VNPHLIYVRAFPKHVLELTGISGYAKKMRQNNALSFRLSQKRKGSGWRVRPPRVMLSVELSGFVWIASRANIARALSPS